MQTKWVVLALVLGLVWGCEDADAIEPTPAIEPLPDITAYVEPGTRTFTAETTGDSTGRARFCDEMESTEQNAKLIHMDVVPDKSAGGIAFWDEDDNPVSVDTLIGRPEDGKLCDPSVQVEDAFAWGPSPYPIVVFFNPETRLIDTVRLSQAYQGVMEGEAELADGEQVTVTINTRERVRIRGEGGAASRELDEYAASAEQSKRENSWLNHQNINLVYSMIRQTYFDADPPEAGYDCIADQRCDVIYTTPDESTPQGTNVVFQDSGVNLVFSPTGHLQYIYLRPVRKAEFELAGALRLSATEDERMGLSYKSVSVDTCSVDITEDLSFGEFRDRCIVGESREKELSRADYSTEAQRDAVEVAFEGMTLNFLRDTRERGVVGDGERPRDEDRLYIVTYTRSLLAPTDEFVAIALAADYQARLRERLAASLAADAPADHPFRAFDVTIPEGLSDQPQRIGELEFPVPGVGMVSFVPVAMDEVRAAYAAMSAAQQAAISEDVLSDVSLVEPFVDAVMAALSHGKSDTEEAYKLFQTVENERWSIGRVSFMQDGVPYRLMVQYSLYFGAVTAVTVAKGYNEVDGILNAVVSAAQQAVEGWTSPYYDLRLALPGIAPGADPSWNPYCLGCQPGIEVGAVDRLNNTLEVTLPVPGADRPLKLVVPGGHMEDRAGFMRQLRGERFEFVPAHRIDLYGKEVSLTLYVTADGTIGRVDQGTFKGAPSLCAGLSVGYGDNVRQLVSAWKNQVPDGVYQACDLVFNYSPDGTVLDGVTSLSNRITFYTTAERAVSFGMWL